MWECSSMGELLSTGKRHTGIDNTLIHNVLTVFELGLRMGMVEGGVPSGFGQKRS